ncbi:MAG: DoxX family protein [Firmicutes bacterium]|nr:DoxX family protein [Bacillota bacterium]
MKKFALLLKGMENYKDGALLFVRLVLCFMFVYVHGGPKLFGGPEKWLEVGSMLKVLGITSMPVFLGFIAAVCEFLGGILIGLGLFTRLGALMILATLAIAAPVMFTLKGLFVAAPATEDALFMIVLMVVGAGKYSLDYLWFER